MATSAEWAAGYARQAEADFALYRLLEAAPEATVCHRLHALQMACEKLAKAYLCGRGSVPADLQGSHAYIARTLPVTLREASDLIDGGRQSGRLRSYIRHLGQEIEPCRRPLIAAAGGRTTANTRGRTPRAGYGRRPTGHSRPPTWWTRRQAGGSSSSSAWRWTTSAGGGPKIPC